MFLSEGIVGKEWTIYNYVSQASAIIPETKTKINLKIP